MSLADIQPESYVDYLCHDKSWKVAIVSENTAQGLHLRVPIDSQCLEDTVQPSSYKVALFRTRTVTGHCGKLRLALGEMQQSLASAIRDQLDYQEPHSVIHFFRGSLYFYTDALLTTVPEGRPVVEQTVAYLQSLIELLGCWLGKVQTHLVHIPTILRDAKTVYSSGEAAVASIYPELFALVERLLEPEKSDVLLKVSPSQCSAVERFMEGSEYTSLSEYLWTNIEGFIQSLIPLLTPALPCLTLIVQLPVWSYAFAHSLSTSCSRTLASLFLTCTQYINQVDLELCCLSKLWLAISFVAKWELDQGRSSSVYAFGLQLTLTVLKSESLERRLEALGSLNRLIKIEKQAPGLGEALQQHAETFLAAIQVEQHEEVLKLYGCVINWLQSIQALDQSLLRHLFKSAIHAHGAYSSAVFTLLLESINQHSDLTCLTEEISTMTGADLDLSSLTFLTALSRQIKGESSGFTQQLLTVLHSLVFDAATQPSIRTAATEAYVAALKGAEDDQQGTELLTQQLTTLTFESPAQHSIEFLWQLMHGLPSLAAPALSAFERTFDTTFSNIAVTCCEKLLSIQQSWAVEELRYLLLICAQVSKDSLTSICALMLACSEAVVRTAVLQFLVEEIGRPWHRRALEALFAVSDLEDIPLYREMTPEQYKLFKALFFELNAQHLQTEKGVFLMRIRPSMLGIPQFLRIIQETANSSVLSSAQMLLIELLVLTMIPDPTGVFIIAKFLLSKRQAEKLVRGLEMLKALWTFQDKYKRLERRESDLASAVNYMLEQLPYPSLTSSQELLRLQLSELLDSTAKKQGVHYFQIKLTGFKGSEEGFAKCKIMETPFNRVDMGFLLDEYMREFKEALGSAEVTVAKAAFQLIPCLLPTSTFLTNVASLGQHYRAALDVSDMSQRLLVLLSLQHLSTSPDFRKRYSSATRSDLLNLVRLLDQDVPPLDLIKHYKHKLVLYCEVLIDLLAGYYGQGEVDRKDVAVLLSLLCVVGMYYTLKEADADLSTTVVEKVGKMISGQKDLIGLFKDSDFDSFPQVSLVESRSSSFAHSSHTFLCTLLCSHPSVLPWLSSLLPLSLDLAFKQPSKSKWFFSLIAHLPTVEFPIPTNKLMSAMEEADKELWIALLGVAEKAWADFGERQGGILAENVLNGLFPLPGEAVVPRLASEGERRLGLQLLSLLSRNHALVANSVVTALSQHHSDSSWRRPGTKWWAVTASSKELPEYVGFLNLGATCYMNSVLQQLGIIREFVLGVLSYSPQTDLLQAFQNLLLSLRYKRKSCQSTAALLPYLPNGPIDPKEQMDAEEFFNSFLTKLEGELDLVGGKGLIEDLFKGRVVTILTGKDLCTHSRMQHQTFLCLTLDIQEKSSVMQSLAALTHSETMHGSNMIECELCGQRVTTESRQQLQHLPNLLFLSLRRFNYDMQAQRRYKINSYCEFPELLDLTSVAAEVDCPKDYYQYQLRGVVVHFGMAEAGHYYSLIRGKSGNWIKMDDTQVTDFNVKDLAAEAYGEKEEVVYKGEKLHLGKSAYMLVYERTGRYKYREQPGPLVPIDKMEWQGPIAREVEAKYEGKRSMQVKAWTLFSREYRLFVADSSFFPPSFLLSYFLTVHLRTKQWWLQWDLLELLLDRVRREAKELGFWLSEVLSCEGVLEEFLVQAVPMQVKKAFASILTAAFPYLTDTQKARFLYKMTCKMETLVQVTSSDLVTFFEVMWHLVASVLEYAGEIQTAERLLCQLVGLPRLPPLSPKSLIYTPETYLGHPLPCYSAPISLSSTSHIGFQLAIFSLCRTQVASTLWESLRSFPLLCLPTAFERYQAAELLAGLQRLPPIGELKTEKQRDTVIGTLLNVCRQSEGRMTGEVANALAEVRSM